MPKVNIRKTPVSITGETHTISNDIIRLEEVCVQNTLTIPGLTETSGEPVPGQFKIDYFVDSYNRTVGGIVRFTSGSSGSVVCAYTGAGSPIWAEDWNYLIPAKMNAGVVSAVFSGIDLNSIEGTCFDYADTPTNGPCSAALGSPNGYFSCHTSGTAGYSTQYFKHVTTDNKYMRSRIGGTFSDWRKEYNSGCYGNVIWKTQSFSPTLAEQDTFFFCLSSSTITITIPAYETLPWYIGTEFVIYRYGTGAVTIAPAANVYIDSVGSLRSVKYQFDVVVLKCVAQNTWALFGSLS